MVDARGKSVFYRPHASSSESDDSPIPKPPKKKISPNHRGGRSLPPHNTGTNHSSPIPETLTLDTNSHTANPTASNNQSPNVNRPGSRQTNRGKQTLTLEPPEQLPPPSNSTPPPPPQQPLLKVTLPRI